VNDGTFGKLSKWRFWQVKPPSVDLKLNGGPSGRGKGPASINLVEVQELW